MRPQEKELRDLLAEYAAECVKAHLDVVTDIVTGGPTGVDVAFRLTDIGLDDRISARLKLMADGKEVVREMILDGREGTKSPNQVIAEAVGEMMLDLLKLYPDVKAKETP